MNFKYCDDIDLMPNGNVFGTEITLVTKVGHKESDIHSLVTMSMTTYKCDVQVHCNDGEFLDAIFVWPFYDSQMITLG